MSFAEDTLNEGLEGIILKNIYAPYIYYLRTQCAIFLFWLCLRFLLVQFDNSLNELLPESTLSVLFSPWHIIREEKVNYKLKMLY